MEAGARHRVRSARRVKATPRVSESAFTTVAERLWPALVGYAAARIGDPDEAADLAQEALLRTWQRRDSLRDLAGLPNYLRRAVANLCRNYLRDHRVIEDLNSREVPAAEASPEDALLREEEGREVLDAIADLPAPLQEVLYVKYADGLSYEEIGEFLDLSPHTIDWRLRRARGLLARHPAVLRYLHASQPQPCRRVRLQLPRIVDGESAPAETAVAQSHLAGCAECRTVLRELAAEFVAVGAQVRRVCRRVPAQLMAWRGARPLWHHAYYDRPAPRQLARMLADLQLPGEPETRAAMLAAVRRRHMDTAQQLAAEVAWAHPAHPAPHTALSLLALCADDMGTAMQHATLAARLGPCEPAYGIALAERLLQGGDPGEAQRELQRTLHQVGPHAAVLTALARARFLAADYEGALQAAGEAIGTHPGGWEPWHWRGMALQGQLRFGAAARAFRASLRRMPDKADPFEALACLSSPQAAQELLASAARAAPDDPWTYVTIGHYYTLNGRYDEEAQVLEQAVRLDPDNGYFHTFRGGALLLAGRDQEARRHLLKAIRLKPDWHPPFYRLGRIAERAGRPREAERWFRRTIELGPLPPVSPHQLDIVEAALKLADLLVPRGDTREALALCERALRSAPDDPDLVALKAQLQRAAGI